VKLRKMIRDFWEPYPTLNWPWYCKLPAMFTRHVPGAVCAWHFNREIAQFDIWPLRIIWAEGYLFFWVLIVAMYRKEGEQWGFGQIVRATTDEEKARRVARGFARAWRQQARDSDADDMPS